MKAHKLTIVLVLIVAMMFGTLMVLLQSPRTVQGSIETGQGYNASSTKDQLGNSIADLQVLKKGSGMLGSVILTGTSTGTFILYDATTTDATLRTNTATTTIAAFPTVLTPGTYTFDITFNYGLILDYTTAVATGTITWK